jgi:Protein of unknown function (DUF2975)
MSRPVSHLVSHPDRLIKTSRLVVRTAWVANRILLVALAVGLVLSWTFSKQFAEWILTGNPGTNLQSAMTGIRWLIVIGIAGSAATDRILVALVQVIATVGAGDPFVRANAQRLQTIAWALFVLQLLDIPGGLIGRFYPGMGSFAPSDTISIVGWISVLMVFVLSRVFAAGSAMRDELEGTV